jgi:hypothetical protein
MISDTSWFIMGASDSSELIGSWQPFTSADGQVIDCLSSSEQAVTNQNSILENPNQLEFTFYWMAPPSFNDTVIFVATIFQQNTTNDNSSLQYIQSTPIQIEQNQGRERYQDVNPSIFFHFFLFNNLFFYLFKIFVIQHSVLMVVHVFMILYILIVDVLHLGMV